MEDASNPNDFEDWEAEADEPVPVCPRCASFSLEYKGEAYDDLHHEGSAYRCDECGLSFTEESARDGTWE